MKKLLLAIVLIVTATPRAFGANYEMADLKALEKQSAWKELTEHLLDIAPSKRDATWQALAEKSCSEYIGALPVKEGRAAESVMAQIDELLTRIPQVKTSKVFLAKRADVGMAVFKATYGEYRHQAHDDPWMTKLKAFVESDTQTADLPMRAVKLIMGRLIPVVAFPFAKQAVDRQGKAACKDADIQKSIIGAIDDGSWKDDYTKIVGTTCWDELKGPLLAEIEKTDSKTLPKNGCPLFESKNALPKNLADKCHPKAPF